MLRVDQCDTHLQEGWKQHPGEYRPVSLALVLGEAMEQMSSSATTLHGQHSQGTRPSQHGFVRGCLGKNNLVFFQDSMAHLEREGKAVGVPTQT